VGGGIWLCLAPNVPIFVAGNAGRNGGVADHLVAGKIIRAYHDPFSSGPGDAGDGAHVADSGFGRTPNADWFLRCHCCPVCGRAGFSGDSLSGGQTTRLSEIGALGNVAAVRGDSQQCDDLFTAHFPRGHPHAALRDNEQFARADSHSQFFQSRELFCSGASGLVVCEPGQMNELELLAKLIPTLPSHPSVKVGAGDDCAVLDLGIAERLTLFKTDSVVEGVHFKPGTEGERIGHKALARALSDIAAMGGKPSVALVTLGLPEGFNPDQIEAIYKGLNRLAEKYQVAVAGGEITVNPGQILISVALLGDVGRDRCILRSGGQPGDAIFVTGSLGGSIEGKHLDFEPRVREAEWLTENFALHAMIDLSDGLARDLRHILVASGVGAELLLSAIPVSRTAWRRAREQAGWIESAIGPSEYKPGWMAALTDGEDFELLFTIASRDAVRLLDRWKIQFPDLQLTCIGKLIPGQTLMLRDRQGARPFAADGYVHFHNAQPS
jgi:thiamine-monophosphate kinase